MLTHQAIQEKFRNLTYDEIGSFLFDVHKINPTDCLRFNYATGRFNMKEVMFKPNVDTSKFVGLYVMMSLSKNNSATSPPKYS